jgi:flagellar protein FlgJ
MATRLSPSKFVSEYAKHAIRNESVTGVPALVTLAQAAGESGWSGSRPGNMMFGIKADSSWRGRVQYLWTQEVYNGVWQSVKAPFRAYNSIQESFEDHSQFLIKNSRYHPAFQFKREPYKFMYQIASAGYATAPKYYEFMAGIMNTIAPLLTAYRIAHPIVGNEKLIVKATVATVAVGLLSWGIYEATKPKKLHAK